MRVVCDRLVQGGLALAKNPEGKVVLVDGALMGETVDCEVDRDTAGCLFAHVVSVVEPSPDRVEPRCPYYRTCGGCDLQILRKEKQPEAKEALVRENLRRVGGFDALPSLGVDFGPAWGYRCRVRFHVNLAKRDIGFLGRKSNQLVPVDDCPVLVDPLRRLLREKSTLLEAARRLMFSGGGEHGIFPVQAFAGDDGVTVDRTVVHLAVGGHRFSVDGQVFFQSNRYVLPQMGAFVRSQTKGESVMDLYGGVGTFSSFVGGGKKVTLVERDKNCLRLAKENAPFAAVYGGDVKDWKQRGKVDTVIIDPPRIGLDRTVPPLIAGWDPQRIIYMSCNSVTLARDMALFLDEGYNPLVMKVFDMYPQTFGQEACVVMGRTQ